MLSVTFDRVSSLIDPSKIFVLTVESQVDLVHQQLPLIPEANIFPEPAGRNTAPSLAVAAAMALAAGDDEPLLCCPSDHIINDASSFERVVRQAAVIASKQDILITFGIRPVYPSTGYGYIESGSPLDGGNGDIYSVSRFHEKPEIEKARDYINRSGYYWNSGIFMWRPSVFLDAWKRFVPEGTEPLERISEAIGSNRFIDTVGHQYPLMPAVSVDYGILEKADNVAVIPADLGWNDVGSWDALYDILPADEDGNRSPGKVESIDSTGNLFFHPGGTIAAIGVKDLIIVVDGDTVMVCGKGESQRVRSLVEKMEKEGKKEIL